MGRSSERSLQFTVPNNPHSLEQGNSPDSAASLQKAREQAQFILKQAGRAGRAGIDCLIDLLSKEILRHRTYLACGSANTELAQEVADILDIKLDKTMDPNSKEGKVSLRRYAEGEVCPEIGNVDGKTVFFIQSPSPGYIAANPETGEFSIDPKTGKPKIVPGINDHLMELFSALDAIKRAGARKTIAVIPHFPYARQDRKDRRGVPITASMLAQMIEERGAHQICALDLHSEQITGSVKIPFDVHYSSYVFIPWAKQHLNIGAVVSPDAGALKMAKQYSRMLLDHPHAGFVDKERDVNSGSLTTTGVSIDVSGLNVLIPDDLTGSFGTLEKAALRCKEGGAADIFAMVPHDLSVGGGLERLLQCDAVTKLITTNTIAHRPEVLAEANKPNGKLEIISAAPLIAEVIRHIMYGEDTQDLFYV